MSQPTIMEQLRAATAGQHGAVEALPFVLALVSGALPAASYAGFIRAMRTIHAALEGALARSEHPLVRAVWAPELARLDLLEADARFWAGEPEIAEAQIAAQVLADKLRRRAETDPAALLGALYVLVGSTLGGAVVRRHAARAYGLRGAEGTAYLSGTGLKARWRRFGERMDAALADPAARAPVLAAAGEMFAGIGAMVAALHPARESSADQLAALNPEAGAHAIPGDLREIEAALRAGARSWAECPYYAMRYGERGERFTRSDSAWIATLAAHDEEQVARQVFWLARVLAARGMPRWLLEQHLKVLYHELSAAAPEHAGRYGKLLAAAERLRDERRRCLGDADLARLARGFDAAAGPSAALLPGAGTLIAAAVADERAGVRNALASLLPWLTDPGRFPPEWIAAVRETADAARLAAASADD